MKCKYVALCFDLTKKSKGKDLEGLRQENQTEGGVQKRGEGRRYLGSSSQNGLWTRGGGGEY